MQTQDEVVEAAKKALARSHRINQFFWGWCWAQVFDCSMKLAGGTSTELSPWVLLGGLVLNGVMALYFQKQVLGVGFSYTVTKK